MHSLLENYLTEVAAHLSALPPSRRNEELREVQAHLESAVAAMQESGAGEAEAVGATLEQFGQAKAVARGFVAAWREQKKGDRDERTHLFRDKSGDGDSGGGLVAVCGDDDQPSALPPRTNPHTRLGRVEPHGAAGDRPCAVGGQQWCRRADF